MLKLAAKTFDVYSDIDMTIARKLPSDLALTKIAERDTVEALDDKQFGLVLKTAGGVLRRHYPLHESDATKLSRAYFDEIRVTLPSTIVSQVDAKIAAAEQTFGLRDAGLSMEQAAEILTKVAYVDAEAIKHERKKTAYTEFSWGLMVNGKNAFPLHDAVLVKTAAERFPFTSAELYPHEKFEYARAIAKRAEALGVTIAKTSSIHNYTNAEVNVDTLKQALDERKRIMKSAGISTEIVDQLALSAGCLPDRGDIEKDASWTQKLSKLAAIQRLPADRIVATLQGIDKFAGFTTRHYNVGLADPFAACFKRADALPATVIDGVDLSKVNPEHLASAFDANFVGEFNENPTAVYSSSPDPVKALIRSLAERGTTEENAGAVQQPAPHVAAGGEPQERLAPVYTNATGSLAY